MHYQNLINIHECIYSKKLLKMKNSPKNVTPSTCSTHLQRERLFFAYRRGIVKLIATFLDLVTLYDKDK